MFKYAGVVFMNTSKVVCDDTYSNKSWRIVGQNLYTLKEVNQIVCDDTYSNKSWHIVR
jgi:hypothetical protein